MVAVLPGARLKRWPFCIGTNSATPYDTIGAREPPVGTPSNGPGNAPISDRTSTGVIDMSIVPLTAWPCTLTSALAGNVTLAPCLPDAAPPVSIAPIAIAAWRALIVTGSDNVPLALAVETGLIWSAYPALENFNITSLAADTVIVAWPDASVLARVAELASSTATPAMAAPLVSATVAPTDAVAAGGGSESPPPPPHATKLNRIVPARTPCAERRRPVERILGWFGM